MSSVPKPITPSVNQWNAQYLEEQYQAYTIDPSSVSAETRAFFQGFDLANAQELKLFGVSSTPNKTASDSAGSAPAPSGPIRVAPTTGRPAGKASHFEAIVDGFIGTYRDQGHLCAQIDPFGRPRAHAQNHSRLDITGSVMRILIE